MRFSLSSIVVALTLIGCLIAFFLNFRTVQNAKRLSERITELEESAKLQAAFNLLVSGLNVNDARHRDAFWIVQTFLPTRAELLTGNIHEGESEWDREFREAIGNKIDLKTLDNNGMRILLVHRNSHQIPGNVVTALALLDGDVLVDVISHKSYTRTEHHSVSLRDVDNDGITDAEIICTPGQWALNPQNRTLQYLVTDSGFQLVPPTANAG